MHDLQWIQTRRARVNLLRNSLTSLGDLSMGVDNFPPGPQASHTAAAHAQFSPNIFVWWRLSKQIEKAIEAMANWLDFLQAVLAAGNAALRWVPLQRALDDQSLHQRRLTEALIAAICFSDINDVRYYRHYLLYTNLDYLAGEIQDAADFYDVQYPALAQEAQQRLQDIQAVEADVQFQLNRCWYLRNRNNPIQQVPGGGGRVWQTSRQNFISVLQQNLAQPHEIRALGFSYQGLFGSASKDIHLTISAKHSQYLEVETLFNGVELTLLQCAALLQRIYDLAGEDWSQEAIFGIYCSEDGDTDFSELGRRTLSRGDIVMVLEPFWITSAFFGQILDDENPSPLGFRRLRVRRFPNRAEEVVPALFTYIAIPLAKWPTFVSMCASSGLCDPGESAFNAPNIFCQQLQQNHQQAIELMSAVNSLDI